MSFLALPGVLMAAPGKSIASRLLAMHVMSAAPAWLLLRLPADSSDFSTASAGC